ncbi:LysR family transcriptional regulator [Paraburkholderia sediminicola]|uniref:LysR family transcriptional regulator n=1 Tax=Paraburkholderia sediminicola TaxID=458836 RepID=UPI0038BB16ED
MREINEMQVFVEVAKRGTLSAAARHLGLATSVVSDRIASLERRFGVKLLARTTRQQSLTAAGRTYFEHCESILASMTDAEQAVLRHREEPCGVLRVTAPTPIGRRHIAPLIGRFVAVHADIRVQLTLDDRFTDLVAEGFDIAIRGGRISDSTLVGHELARTRRVVVASPAYVKRHGMPESPADLRKHACVVYNSDGSLNVTWRFGKGDDAQVVRIESILASNNSELPIAWALNGLGVTQKSWWEVAGELRRGELVTVLDAYEPEEIPFVALHHAQSTQSKKIRIFIEYLVAALRATSLHE